MGREYIKTWTKSNKGSKSLSLPSIGTPQSMCVLPDDSIVVLHNVNNANKKANCRKYTKNGYVSGSNVVNYNLGHCNGVTYCNENGLIYCTGYSGGYNTTKVVALSLNLKQKFSFNLPVGISGIGYDSSVKKFYCSKGSKVYVFDYSAFKENGRKKNPSYKTIKVKGSKGQDVFGHNGIIYRVVYNSGYGDIDMYRHSNGKYIGSMKVSFSETESGGFDSNGNFVYLTANQYRGIHWTTWKPQYNDGAGNINSQETKKKGTAAQAFVSVAKKELKEGVHEVGSTNKVKYNTWYYGRPVQGPSNDETYPWCAVFVCWCAHEALGKKWQDTIPKCANTTLQDKIGGPWIKHGGGNRKHIGIIGTVNGTKATTIEGNHGNKVGSRTVTVPSSTKPGDLITFNGSTVVSIRRPAWPDGEYALAGGADGGEGAEENVEATLEVHPEQLFSSNNYHYYQDNNDESEEQKRAKAKRAELTSYIDSIKFNPKENPAVPDIRLASIYSASDYKKPRTKIRGAVSGSPLPCTINYVEAPYGKITLGGVTIGSYTEADYPNYLNSITAKKTNGSLNEYTISLTHQIRPGDNPNYIDNLISATGYDKITIEYGDSEAGIAYKDSDALLINARSSFDFFNNQINYNLSATSSSVMSSINRRNYSAVKAKPSTIITKMLYETGELLEYFPGMSNQSWVNSLGLIPTNDKEVEIDAVENTTPLNYQNKLVSSMVSNTSKYGNDSSYFLSLESNNRGEPYFKIKQVKTNFPYASFPLMYEVDINYPEENSLVYNFSVNTDFSWPLAYKYAGSFPTYDYNIDNAGNLLTEKMASNIKTIGSTQGTNVRDQNWWTSVTEFPIKAVLEVKGLTTYTLLLNYIKVNVFYYGQKRNTSGIYIVTGQEDSLSANGFTTKLDLLRVAGDNQYISVDGRVVT